MSSSFPNPETSNRFRIIEPFDRHYYIAINYVGRQSMRSTSQGMCIPFGIRQANMETVNYHPRSRGPTTHYVSRAIYQHPTQCCSNEQFRVKCCVTVGGIDREYAIQFSLPSPPAPQIEHQVLGKLSPVIKLKPGYLNRWECANWIMATN